MEIHDTRFKKGARFKRRRDKKVKKDERFDKVFKEETKVDFGPKIDPFGRPLENIALDEIHSSDDDLEEPISIVQEEPEESIEYGEESDRIAVVGCDWDNITADDLFVLFETVYRSVQNNNFVKAVKRTAIYLSDIGEAKIKKEDLHGPEIAIDETRDEEEDEETRQDALRKYQKERSRYFYGIVELENIDKARVLYDELDGVEVSFAIDGLDLRFVPSTISFPREPTSESTCIPDNYEPPVSSQSALRHSKVECKWDLTPAKRFKTLTRRFNESDLASIDLSEYLASEDDDEDIDNLKGLLTVRADKEDEASESDPDGNMSATVGNIKVSFGPDSAVPTKSRIPEKPKKQKKADDREEGRHFDMRTIKKSKGKKVEQQSGFASNFDDERLNKLFKDPKFAIDTTDPNYSRTEFNEKLLEQKRTRRE